MTQQGQSEQQRRVPSSFGKDKPWLCYNCNFMLGLVAPGGKTLRIKYKDLYLVVQGGRVEELCRKCGRVNALEYTPDGSGEVTASQNIQYSVVKTENDQVRRRPR